jgi:phosphotransferase system HPr (HPr) family protein
MVEEQTTINIEEGLHARPAAIFVNTANKFESDVYIIKDDKRINAKSIMGVLMLALYKGCTISLMAEGPDEQEALDALKKICEEQ